VTGTTTESRGTGCEPAPGERRTPVDTALRATFAGEGEMAERCRALDWAVTPLGTPDAWPTRLRATAELVLASALPMALLWGPELVQLYNDGYRALMGPRHPAGLGQPVRTSSPEEWERHAPLYARVRTGASVLLEDAQLPGSGPGGRADARFTLAYSPVRGDEGAVAGVLVTAVETTARVRTRTAEEARALDALTASEARFRTVQDASPLGFCVHRPVWDADGTIVDFTTPYINAAGARIVGQPRERVMTERLLAIWPAAAAEGIVADYARVLATGESNVRELLYEQPELVAGLTLTAVRIGAGADAEVGVTFTDVTTRLRGERERARLAAALEAERERLRAVLLQAPTPMALLVGPEHRFELLNDAYMRVSGGGRDLTGLTFREAYPELEGQPFFEIQDRVYATGEPWAASAVPVRYDRRGTGIEDAYFDLRYEPVRDAEGRVFALLNYGVDVTEQVHARRAVEELLAASERARAEAEAARARSRRARCSSARSPTRSRRSPGRRRRTATSTGTTRAGTSTRAPHPSRWRGGGGRACTTPPSCRGCSSGGARGSRRARRSR
jgi:PAS domain-containing protein